MKCAVIFADNIKQIMLSPENDSEKFALRLITAQDDISVDVKQGTLFTRVPSSALGYIVQPCQGGYLRAYEQEDAVMLVLRKREEKSNEIKTEA
jgi:hypothetical protein